MTTVDSDDWLAKPGTVGKPTPIMEVIVIKDDGSVADPMEAGQIYVKNLMGSDFEYHQDKEKTEQAHLESDWKAVKKGCCVNLIGKASTGLFRL